MKLGKEFNLALMKTSNKHEINIKTKQLSNIQFKIA